MEMYVLSSSLPLGHGKFTFCAHQTRFHTEYIAAERLVAVKSALQEIAVSEIFQVWANRQAYKDEAMRVKLKIMDAVFWEDVELMVEPIIRL